MSTDANEPLDNNVNANKPSGDGLVDDYESSDSEFGPGAPKCPRLDEEDDEESEASEEEEEDDEEEERKDQEKEGPSKLDPGKDA